MNGTQLNCLLVMTLLWITDFGPLSLICLIGMYVLIARPRWFHTLVANLYRNSGHEPNHGGAGQAEDCSRTTGVRLKCFLCLLVILLLDIAPVPVTGSIGLYVVIRRPAWFRALVERIYCGIR